MQIPLPRGARTVPGRMPRRGTARGMLRRGTARGEGSSRKDTSFGDKCISPGAGRAFPPRNCCHLGTKCLPGEGSSRKLQPFGDKVPSGSKFSWKDTLFGDKSISPGTTRAFPPENRNHLGTKCLPGEGFSRKDTSFGDKSIPPCITPCGKQCFCCF